MEIPDDIADAIRLLSKEMDRESHKKLVLALYQRGVLSSGKACSLAGMTHWEFEDFLGLHRVQRHYTDENLEEDINYARSHQ